MVSNALGVFKSMLEGIRSVLHGGDGKSAAVIGGHAIVGAIGGIAAGTLAGGIYGTILGGPIGMAGGALGGGILGAVGGGTEGVAETYMKNQQPKKPWTASGLPPIEGGGNNAPPIIVKPAALPPISLSINLDGRTLAQAVSSSIATLHDFPTGAPAADGMAQPFSGDHNQSDN